MRDDNKPSDAAGGLEDARQDGNGKDTVSSETGGDDNSMSPLDRPDDIQHVIRESDLSDHRRK